ncbi:unnamed protein product [Clonostachys rhizophaga]|uniref:Rhodopsin domain-containing protein n=1 Tax=Clonostachys rhizophaga TaxID=160324 RepID=A0A9N9VC88_9HYPO|nr:unnamed protein product [Clonostachys rhizophaga]
MGTLEEGKQIQAQAYATASIQPLGLGPASNGLIYFFSALVTIVLGLRVYVRFFSRKVWGWDDLLAIAGYVAFVPSNVLGVIASYYGLGAYKHDLDPDTQSLLQIRAIEYFMYYEILYFAASATTKVSITIAVLRLCDKHDIYRWIAIGNATLMIVAAGAAGVFVLTNCRPFAVYWNADLGVCTFGDKGLASLKIVSLVGSSFQMLSDWVSAILPFFIIYKLQMPSRTKTALIGVLSLGILASAAALARMLYYGYWDTKKHPDTLLYYTAVIVITSELEVGLGMIACSLPPLGRMLRAVFSTHRSNGNSDMRYNGPGNSGTPLRTLPTSGLRSHPMGKPSSEWAHLGDNESERKSGESKAPIYRINRETTVQVEVSKADSDGSIENAPRKKGITEHW